MNSKLSQTMIQLYGKEAQKVADRCEAVDPWFGEYVQRVIYDEIWTLPPLSLAEKSLITIVCLTTLNKEEQLQIHLQGYFNLGGSRAQIKEIFNYLLECRYITSQVTALAILQAMEIAETFTVSAAFDLSTKNKALMDVACHATLGNNANTKTTIGDILKESLLSEEYIRAVLRQIMPYVGCPATMNGFAILNEVKATQAIYSL